MIHHTCDRCKRKIDPDQELRYVVKLEIHAAMEPLDCHEVEDDRDHLMEIHEILERLEDGEADGIADDIYQRRRYDLCPACYRQYVKNPIGREPAAQLGFSQN